MPKLPCVSGEETVKALKKLGFTFLRQRGSHAILRRGNQGCVVPMHREINQGTLRGVLKQAGVAEEEFRNAL
ncbi:MAG TPA: type II toxin-antitoxin system HicA family toxin [Candidatus Binatia bacterium]|nr:type II toxin-antitoxin system HicA family toxin [Candidatus Binatia bacterium]